MISFTTLYGKQKKINYFKYEVDWDGKCRSKFQKRIKDFLKDFWKNDLICEEFPLLGTRMTFDIYNVSQKIAIEVQGQQHLEYNKFFHGQYKNNFLNQLRRDSDKVRYCELNDIKFVEIYPEDEPVTIETFSKQGIVLKRK